MLHIGICDDDRIVLENLAREVEGWAKEKAELCSVECFLTADSFLFAWDEKKGMDVLLLDIEMPGMDGMELARHLRKKGEHISIIFVTGNSEYALDGYDLEAVSYLVKPVKRERLYSALNRARERLNGREALLVTVSAGEIERIYISDICFLESEGHGTVVCKRDGTKISGRVNLRQLEQELEERSEAFFKPHRSYFINLGYVEKITKKDIRMDDGTLIPIARGKWEALNRAYMGYFRRKY